MEISKPMNLVKTPYAPLPVLSITPEAEDRRNELAISALEIKAITNQEQNERARNIAVEIRNHIKEVDAAASSLSRPIDDAKKSLLALKRDHCEPLSNGLKHLDGLATVFLKSESKRIEAEEKARLDLAAEAKTDQDFHSVMAAPIVEESRARGQQMRKVLRWQVTDIAALANARPDLVRMEPKASAIQAVCIPEMPNLPPGLRLWWDEKATFTTR